MGTNSNPTAALFIAISHHRVELCLNYNNDNIYFLKSTELETPSPRAVREHYIVLTEPSCMDNSNLLKTSGKACHKQINGRP